MLFEKHYIVTMNVHEIEQKYTFTNRIEVLEFVTSMRSTFGKDITNVSIEEKLVTVEEVG